jgi:hypothetical protein
MVVRALGHECQPDAVCALLDETPLPPSSRLDVRAYTTVLHALSPARAGTSARSSSSPSSGTRVGDHVEEVDTDGDCLFTTARTATAGKVDARELRHRAVH